MEAVVRPGPVGGVARAPPAKSETHRAMIALALAGGGSIDGPLQSDDTRATGAGLTALGAEVRFDRDSAEVKGFDSERPTAPSEPIDCRNSGTTLRLLAGVAALADGVTTLTGDASLRTRPNRPLLDAIESLGGTATGEGTDGTAPVRVGGPITGGSVRLPGSISSQFVSSLLLVGGATPDGIDVVLTTPLISAPYVDLTIDALASVDIAVEVDASRYRVAGGRRYRSANEPWPIGPDPTGASYLLAAGVLAGAPGVTIPDIGRRGGHAAPILNVLHQLNIRTTHDGGVTVSRSSPHPARIDLGAAPDLVPTVCVLAAMADGQTRVTNCAHLRHKESDRIATTASLVRSLGRSAESTDDGLIIHGDNAPFDACTIDPHGDHRIAMAGAVAGLAADGPVRIPDADVVDVSFPRFFETLAAIGADVELIPAQRVDHDAR